jgi:hypothetical protein
LASKSSTDRKIYDQDIGNLLALDPADSSHWKHGRKNISSLQSLRKIADALSMDLTRIEDVLLHEVEEDDNTFVSPQLFLNRPDRVRQVCIEQANQFVKEAGVYEFPIFLPELIEFFQKNVKDLGVKPEELTHLSCVSKKMKIAYSIAYYLLCNSQLPSLGVSDIESYSRIMAIYLLTPSHLVKKFFLTCHRAQDVSEAFMKAFWVNRSIADMRTIDFLIYQS